MPRPLMPGLRQQYLSELPANTQTAAKDTSAAAAETQNHERNPGMLVDTVSRRPRRYPGLALAGIPGRLS
ncbi:Uncharacterised protein [Mycobacteroides abscessus subsp. abscessus]|nr:Uncharacterised protein [Mycobacteroides abscessus subsp. abscessus]